MNLNYLNEQAKNSFSTINDLVNAYLKTRKYGKKYEEQLEEYGMRDLKISSELIIPESIVDTILEKVYTFYCDMNICKHLINHIIKDLNDNKEKIEHNEVIEIKELLNIVDDIQHEVTNSRNEAKNLLESENINITLPSPVVSFDEDVYGRVRHFLIIKFVIDKLDKFCNEIKD